MRLYASDLEKSREFYSQQLGLGGCQTDAALCFQVNPSQRIELDSASGKKLTNQLESVTFRVRDAAGVRAYLTKNGVQASEVTTAANRVKWFEVIDPEGHHLRFMQYPRAGPVGSLRDASKVQVSTRIIHVGYVVPDRFRSDQFYRDVLGFRPYWHGGRKDDQDDWVALQVPDGTDWVEYMLNVSPNADHHTQGVMNHIALGVVDIQTAKAELLKNGWRPGEEPKLGRDGKWQLNVYDPDDTRIEFMEFTPREKPCCSEFTGPHPAP
jgi:catechol 2,3-dioxygenase-like lactoylglutathione lyase family enzyme